MNWLEQHITLQNYDDRKAERENAFTHFAGSFLALIGFIYILMSLDSMKDNAVRAGMIVFGLTNILLYTASGF